MKDRKIQKDTSLYVIMPSRAEVGYSEQTNTASNPFVYIAIEMQEGVDYNNTGKVIDVNGKQYLAIGISSLESRTTQGLRNAYYELKQSNKKENNRQIIKSTFNKLDYELPAVRPNKSKQNAVSAALNDLSNVVSSLLKKLLGTPDILEHPAFKKIKKQFYDNFKIDVETKQPVLEIKTPSGGTTQNPLPVFVTEIDSTMPVTSKTTIREFLLSNNTEVFKHSAILKAWKDEISAALKNGETDIDSISQRYLYTKYGAVQVAYHDNIATLSFVNKQTGERITTLEVPITTLSDGDLLTFARNMVYDNSKNVRTINVNGNKYSLVKWQVVYSQFNLLDENTQKHLTNVQHQMFENGVFSVSTQTLEITMSKSTISADFTKDTEEQKKKENIPTSIVETEDTIIIDGIRYDKLTGWREDGQEALEAEEQAKREEEIRKKKENTTNEPITDTGNTTTERGGDETKSTMQLMKENMLKEGVLEKIDLPIEDNERDLFEATSNNLFRWENLTEETQEKIKENGISEKEWELLDILVKQSIFECMLL